MSGIIIFAIAASYSIYITVCKDQYKIDKSIYIFDVLLILAAVLALRL